LRDKAKHKVYRIAARDGLSLIYIPSLGRVMRGSNEEANDYPEYIVQKRCSETCGKVVEYPPQFKSLQYHLTNRCNMKCIYCYSDSDQLVPDLSLKQIENAFNYYACHSSEEDLHVGFMGGGEPTVAWRQLVHAVSYATMRANKNNKRISFSIISNGLWNADQLDFIETHFNQVTLSIDGNADINDRRRIRPDGTGTYDHVCNVARRIHANQTVELRITPLISADTVERLEDIILCLCKEFSGVSIDVSMLRIKGARVATSGLAPPRTEVFLQNLLKAERAIQAMRYNNVVDNPFFNFDLTTMPYFCDAAGGNCIISSHGYVTSCSSVTDYTDAGSDVFIFGKVDDKGIVFYEDKYRALADKLNIRNIDECSECFASYVCRGGCPSVKADNKSFWCLKSPDCDAIKEALSDYLWYVTEPR